MAKKVDKLQFLRVVDFNLIPRKYFEQMDVYEPEEIDRIYRFGKLFTMSPTTLLFTVAGEDKITKGFLWASVDIVDRTIYVRGYSLDKEYQQTSRAGLEIARDAIHEAIEGSIVKDKIVWMTKKPAAFLKYGGKKSEFTLIEFESEDKNVQDDNRPDVGERTDDSGQD